MWIAHTSQKTTVNRAKGTPARPKAAGKERVDCAHGPKELKKRTWGIPARSEAAGNSRKMACGLRTWAGSPR